VHFTITMPGNRLKTLQINVLDNVAVALDDIPSDYEIRLGNLSVRTKEPIPAKHKVLLADVSAGDQIIMYGTVVGKMKNRVLAGSRISVENTSHDTIPYKLMSSGVDWIPPDTNSFENATFKGYPRSNGKVGTRNYWIVLPLVFCENRNIEVMKVSLLEPLGYTSGKSFSFDLNPLIREFKNHGNIDPEEFILKPFYLNRQNRIFPNLDGIKFLTHDGGCGCTRQDSDMLCRLLASYIAHPNVGGATVLSLGCQNAQISILQEELERLAPKLDKPVFYLEQQQFKTERDFIETCVRKTFFGCTIANRNEKVDTSLDKLCLGLECGGSDGFSGISANPVLGHCTNILVAKGGSAILSEFPELHGVEQELMNRCANEQVANRFMELMLAYEKRAEQDGSAFAFNPSPGNIKNGLITDAMKSAGAALKGGSSPITAVLDYGEIAVTRGLHLLCTPGNDVESTTGLAGAGANMIVFSTGLGTPTGNPIVPVIKVSSNNELAKRMPDIIDFNTGDIIKGSASIAQKGEELLKLAMEVASGENNTAAERLGQDDFIPWKRGISL
jgi:altronate hydrolase